MSRYESPRIRRLRSDLTALERLQAESSVFRFKAHGAPPHTYHVEFLGKSLARDRFGKVHQQNQHEVEIRLGSSYPRTMPELRWKSPIYHPNISEIGMVCLGGYGTNWVPSLSLDELCVMLWDMARYHNYDIRSPYNREAALWSANQTSFTFPTDPRPLRDTRAAATRVQSSNVVTASASQSSSAMGGHGITGTDSRLAESSASQRDGTIPALSSSNGGGADSILILDLELDLRKSSPPPRPPEPEVIFLD